MALAASTVRAGRRVILAASVALASLGASASARAADPFEIQVYDGTANAPGEGGLELHANYVARGSTTGDGAALPTDKVTHLTLEPSYGLLPFWELGGYFQTALRPDGTFDYAGVKLRSKFVTTPTWNEAHPHWRLGVNLELSVLPSTYDPDRWGSEIRPIAAWEDARWLFAINPIVSTPLAGEGSKQGPQLEPAAKAMLKIDHAGVGLEYYSSLGPVASMPPVAAQEHYVYEVFDLLEVARLEVNAGVGEGLTSGSNKLVAKVILGYSF
jgi:hypothetical protein